MSRLSRARKAKSQNMRCQEMYNALESVRFGTRCLRLYVRNSNTQHQLRRPAQMEFSTTLDHLVDRSQDNQAASNAMTVPKMPMMPKTSKRDAFSWLYAENPGLGYTSAYSSTALSPLDIWHHKGRRQYDAWIKSNARATISRYAISFQQEKKIVER